MEHCIYIVSEYFIQFSLLNGTLQSLLNVSLGLQHCFTIVSLEETQNLKKLKLNLLVVLTCACF